MQESLLDTFEFPEIMPLDVALPDFDATASMADGLAAVEGVITSVARRPRVLGSLDPVRGARAAGRSVAAH